jgi:hypothetical protein
MDSVAHTVPAEEFIPSEQDAAWAAREFGDHAEPAVAAVPANGEPAGLAEVVEHEALAFKAWGNPTGDFLAREMGRLAQLVRWTAASTPQEHEERMEV